MLVWIGGTIWTSLEFQICVCFMQCLSWNLLNTSPKNAQISLLPLQIWCLLVWAVINFGLFAPCHNLAHIQYCFCRCFQRFSSIIETFFPPFSHISLDSLHSYFLKKLCAPIMDTYESPPTNALVEDNVVLVVFGWIIIITSHHLSQIGS